MLSQFDANSYTYLCARVKDRTYVTIWTMQSRLYDTDYVVKTVMVPTSRQVWIKIDSQWDQQELGRVNGARPRLCVCWVAPLVHWRSRPDSQTPSGMSVEERQATVLELVVTSSLKIHTLSLYIHPHTRMYTCHTHTCIIRHSNLSRFLWGWCVHGITV